MKTRFLRRRMLITNKPVQLKYLGLLIVSMLVPILFVGSCLYYLIFTIIAEQLGIPESIAINLFPVIKKVNLILAIGVPPLLILLIFWGAILSHRFAGPLIRLENELNRMSQTGDYSTRIKLRKHDDLQTIAESINKLLDKVEGKKR